jgi:hypothetical protein
MADVYTKARAIFVAILYDQIVSASDISMSSEFVEKGRVENNLLHDDKMHIGLLLLPAYAVLVFSYNLHVFWLMYDVVAIILFLYYVLSGEKIISRVQAVCLGIVLLYFIGIVLIGSNFFMGGLSIWDTFKHLLYFPLIANISKNVFSERNDQLYYFIYSFVAFSFFVQVVAVAYQYLNDVHFDSVAGTFGDGGSHAIAYISLLYIVASISFYKKAFFLFSLSCVTIFMNIVSENVGFFVLVIMFMTSLFMIKKKNTKYVFVFIVVIISASLLLSLSMYSQSAFGEVIISRVLDMFEVPDYFDPAANNGRGDFLFLSFQVGGWFGVGPGAYSSIYLLEGCDMESMIDSHIIIAESSHLISESGMVGFLLTIIVYATFISKIFYKRRVKVSMVCIFVACMFYSVLLMNESHIFLLILMFYFFKMIENESMRKQKLLAR